MESNTSPPIQTTNSLTLEPVDLQQPLRFQQLSYQIPWPTRIADLHWKWLFFFSKSSICKPEQHWEHHWTPWQLRSLFASNAQQPHTLSVYHIPNIIKHSQNQIQNPWIPAKGLSFDEIIWKCRRSEHCQHLHLAKPNPTTTWDSVLGMLEILKVTINHGNHW